MDTELEYALPARYNDVYDQSLMHNDHFSVLLIAFSFVGLMC